MLDGDPTALDITTLVIAVIGLAAALLSLGWQGRVLDVERAACPMNDC